MRRHWLFVTVLVLGFLLRIIAQIAYRPALLFNDSYRYLANLNFDPTMSDPVGYPVIVLRPMLFLFGNLASVAALQHLLGLAMGLAIYVVLLRRGVRPWLAAVATIPVLLNAYQLQIEQNVLAETLFESLVVAGVVVLLWRARPRYGELAAAGILLGVAVTVRLVGLPLVVIAAGFAAAASTPGWTQRLLRAGAVALAFALPVVAYAAYYDSFAGRFALTTADASVIAGRAQVIVDCQTIQLPSYERVLCPKEPRGHRQGVDSYAHDSNRLQLLVHPPPGQHIDQVLHDFAIRVFKHQPLDFVGAVLGDFAKGFAWSPTTAPGDRPVARWQFQRDYPVPAGDSAVTTIGRYGGGGPSVIRPLATFLRDYQLTVGFVPGPVLALAFAIGLAAGFGLGRARRSGLRAACLLPTLCGVTLVLAADLFEFSWRYQLPALILAPVGAALGLTALLYPLESPPVEPEPRSEPPALAEAEPPAG